MISISRFIFIFHYCRTFVYSPYHTPHSTFIIHLIIHPMPVYAVNDKDGFVGIAFRSIFGRYTIFFSLISFFDLTSLYFFILLSVTYVT